MLQGFVDIVKPMDTLLITAERRYGMKKSRSCRMKPQPRKRLGSRRTITKHVDLPTAVGFGLVGTKIIGLWCQPLRSDTRGKLRPNNQNYNNFSQKWPFERRDYSSSNNDIYNDYKARSLYQSHQDQSRNWGSNNNYSRSPWPSRQDSSFTDFRSQPWSSLSYPSVFNRFGNQDPRKNKPYEKKFPTSNNGYLPNAVRFTTTDDSINELSGLNRINPILSQFWEQSTGRAINVDALYTIATFL